MPHIFCAQAVKAVVVVLVLHYDAAPLHSLNSPQIRRVRYKVRTPTAGRWTTRCRPRGGPIHKRPIANSIFSLDFLPVLYVLHSTYYGSTYCVQSCAILR